MRIFFVVLALAAAAIAGVMWMARPRPSFGPHFLNRATVPPGRLRFLFQEKTPDEVADDHAAFSENVLMIRRLDVVEHPDFDSGLPAAGGTIPPADGRWSFASVFARAAKVGGGNASPGYVEAWRKFLTTNADYELGAMEFFNPAWSQGSYALDKAPVKLLAVVNRIDQGVAQGKQVCGPEIRFVYAALPVTEPYLPHYLSLIAEFVLPCLSQTDFKALAADWSSLNDPGQARCGSSDYVKKLECVLDTWTARASKARLRVNGNGGGGVDTWDTREFAFLPGGLQIQNLERQPNGKGIGMCTTSQTDLGRFVPGNVAAVLASRHEFSGSLATKNETIVDQGSMITLSSSLALSAPTDDVRFALSINSCLGCHGPETGTHFHQVGQRARGQQSPLSGFLTGSNCDAGGPIVANGYCMVTSPLIDHCGPAPAQRSLNDLLRRHLYMYTVGTLKVGDDWGPQIASFTAYQVH